MTASARSGCPVLAGRGAAAPAAALGPAARSAWLTAPASWPAAEPAWTCAGVVEAPVADVVALALAVRLGAVGPRNAPLLNGWFRSRLTLAGGPERFVADFRWESWGWLGVDVDQQRRAFAVQGRLGWRVETWFEPHERGTLVVRRVHGLSPAKRWAMPFADRGKRGLGAVLRRLGSDLNAPAYRIG